MHREYKYLGWITAAYITMQLVSDVTAGKVINFFSYPVSITVLYFPITYVLADVLTEVYGYARSRSVIWKVLFSSVAAGIIYQLAAYLPPSPIFENNEAYEVVFGVIPRVLIGGWIAVWCGGILNDYILAKMKVWTDGKYLWARTIGSTVVGEFANTALFYGIALSSILPWNILIVSIFSAWIIKVVVEIILTPWTYWVVNKLKKLESEDYFDRNTNFNPLIIEAE